MAAPNPLLNFNSMVETLKDSGFFDYALPFLIVFAIVFGFLEKVRIFGSDPKDGSPRTNINIVLAILIGLYVVTSTTVVERISIFIPKVGLILIMILAFLLMIASFLGEEPKLTGGIFFIAVVFALIATAWAVSTEDLSIGEFSYYWDNYYQSIVVLIVIIVIMVVVIAGRKKDDRMKSWDNFHKMFGGK